MTTAREIIAMSVDAMIKHHQAVAEVITHAMSDYASAATGISWNKACFAFEADAILCALSRAGFRILGPDEIDTMTEAMVEAAVQAVRQYTRDTLFIDEHRELVRAALKAAMEAGRHD